MIEKPTRELLTFPCDFTIKVFGLASKEFEEVVSQIIQRHVPTLTKANMDANIKARPSENNKYVALSITVHVTSKHQLDAIYHDLSSNPLVLMAL